MKRSRLIGLVVLFLCLALGTIGVITVWRQALQAKSQLADATLVYQQLAKKAAATDATQEYSELRTLATKLDTAFNRLGREVDFFERLDSLADAAGVTTTIRVVKEAVPGTMQQLPLEISMSGTYEQTIQFVYSLTKEPAILWPTSLTIDQDGAQGVRAVVTVESFWKPSSL